MEKQQRVVNIRLNDRDAKILGSQVVNGDMRRTATAIWDIIADKKGRSRISSVFLEAQGNLRPVKVIAGRVQVSDIYVTLGRMFPGG